MMPLLADSETLLYEGRPSPRSYARQGQQTFLLGLPVAGFAFAVALLIGYRWDALLILLPLSAYSLYLLTSPLWLRMRANRIRYVVTDRRALIVLGEKRIVRSFVSNDLDRSRLRRRGDGSGDLDLFAEDGNRFEDRLDHGFFGIQDPDTFLASLPPLKPVSAQTDVHEDEHTSAA